MNNLIYDFITEFKDKLTQLKELVPREIQLPDMANKIKVAIGMRRTGKTYYLFQIIQKLLRQKIDEKRILYLNFEDDRLYPLTQEKLRELIDSFYSIYPENHDHLCYLFLDEIANAEQWSTLVRRYFDSKKVEIYLTGSSAKLLSKEIATSLRGRSVAIEIWPFSWQEYLTAKNISFDSKTPSKKAIDKLKKHFIDYLTAGGFPETTNLSLPDRNRILQDYVQVVILRDVIERHHITNIALIRYMIKALIKNTAASFTVNKFYNDLKSQGFSVGKDTIHDYLSYIEDAYLIFSVSLYDESVRKTQTNPKKIYAIDAGLVNAYSISFSKNYGRLFENLIYLDLRRQEHEIYYYLTTERNKVDFYTRDLKGKWHLYQVVWDIEDKDTLQREQRALNEAETELGIKGRLITPEIYLKEGI